MCHWCLKYFFYRVWIDRSTNLAYCSYECQEAEREFKRKQLPLPLPDPSS